MKGNITKITKLILDFMFMGGIIITLAFPLILKNLTIYMDSKVSDYFWQVAILIMLCGMFSLMIIWELRKIFKSVIADNCFVKINVVSLKRMGNYTFIIAAIMLLLCFLLYVTLAALAMVIVFVIAGLFSKVLAQVFDRAVSYKLENDFTI